MIIEKLGKNNHSIILDLIKSCPRKHYFINNDLTLKNFRKINYIDWHNNIIDIKILNIILLCLSILPQNRILPII